MDFSRTVKTMLEIISKNSKEYNVKLDVYRAFISGILYALLFLEKV